VLRVRGRLEFSMHTRGSARSGTTLDDFVAVHHWRAVSATATCLNFDWTIIGCEAATLHSGGGTRPRLKWRCRRRTILVHPVVHPPSPYRYGGGHVGGGDGGRRRELQQKHSIMPPGVPVAARKAAVW